MAPDDGDICHFLHIRRGKYRKQYRKLKKLYRHNEFLVDPKETVKDRSLFKYWKNRRNLFSKIDVCPIYMTDELWFSVTPEMLAIFLAKFVRACLPNAKRILDVFCGGGGNTIHFAKLFPRVYGVDSSLEHLYCTYRNARSYDVSDRIWLKYGSWQRMVSKGRFSRLDIDCVFASPPWGGPQYLKQDLYDLENMLQPMGITEMLRGFKSISENIVLFLPRNSDLKQISRATRSVMGVNAKCRILYVKTNGYLKGIVCMWGEALIGNSEESRDGVDLKEDKDETDSVNYDIDG